MNKGFKILDANGESVSINALDREVCELVGNEYNTKSYAVLGKREEYASNWEFISRAHNWYDTIGWMIADEGKSFQDIINYYKEGMKDFLGKVDKDGTLITIEYIYPYHMKVLNTWIEKGYQPISVDVY